MKVFDYAMTMLKKDKKTTLRFIIVVSITVIINFIFFNMSLTPLITYVSFIVLLVTWFLLVYITNFYLTFKRQEIGMIYLNGGGVKDVFKYLVCQISCIFIFASIVGTILGALILPLLYSIFNDIAGVKYTFSILGVNYLGPLIGILTMLVFSTVTALGYTNQNSITKLMNYSHINTLPNSRFLEARHVNLIYLMMYIVAIVAPLVASFRSFIDIIFVCSIMGIFGSLAIFGMIRRVFIQIIRKWAKKQGVTKNIMLVALSNYIITIQGSVVFIILFILMMILCIPIFVAFNNSTVEYLFCIFIIVIMTLLIALGLICNFLVIGYKRSVEFRQLHYLGISNKDVYKMMKWEVILFYASIIFLPLPILISIIIRYFRDTNLVVNIIIFLVLVFVVFIITGFINYKLYKKIYHGGNRND